MASSKVPPPKKNYPPPEEEPRSEATQVAADRYLHGKPTNADGTAKGGGR
jgi:hypothetical protein